MSPADSRGAPSMSKVGRYSGRVFGPFLFLLSFFLPSVGDLPGFECALWALFVWNFHDDQVSSLAIFGGCINLEILLLFCLSALNRGQRFRSLLIVVILFSIPMTWIALYRMNHARMILSLDRGHFFWIAGILLIVLPEIPSAFRFVLTRWLAMIACAVIAVMSFPILVGLTMRPPSEVDDVHYDLAWANRDPAECEQIDPDVVGRPDQRSSEGFTYMQSDCYRNVGVMLHMPQLCDRVKSGSLDRLVGSVIAKSECRNQKYTIGTAMEGTRSSPFPFDR